MGSLKKNTVLDNPGRKQNKIILPVSSQEHQL